MVFWGQKTFCVIAGASRGIGQALAIQFSRRVSPESVLILLARTESALQANCQDILSDPKNNCSHVIPQPIDLSNPDPAKFRETLENGFTQSGTKPEDFQLSIIVHCAASFGTDKALKVSQLQDIQQIKSYYDFNLTSFIVLNSVFCDVTGANRETENPSAKPRQFLIIHISSHGAIQPYKTWGLYCASRAAKDMLLRSIALESPNIHTLNYAPGLVDTENYREALQFTTDPELLKVLQEEKAKGSLLSPQQTVERLCEILESGKYTKGEHISYEDY